MKFEEIKKAYKDQWVLIDHCVGKNGQIIEGEVVYSSPKKQDVYRKLQSTELKGDWSIQYAGKIPEDLSVLL